jgi:holo-[acyl-carrier protein] synthase
MGILGVGVDMLDVSRMETAMNQTGRPYLEKVFTEREILEAYAHSQPPARFATLYSMKEAILKAFGFGFRPDLGIGLKNIEITHDEYGKPEVTLSGELEELAGEKDVVEIHVSVSTQGPFAVAMAVIETT